LPLEFMVEPCPDQYVLQPGEELVIEAEFEAGDEPFAIHAHDDHLQIFPGVWPRQVWINGEPAKPLNVNETLPR
jgi:hypothetical protein